MLFGTLPSPLRDRPRLATVRALLHAYADDAAAARGVLEWLLLCAASAPAAVCVGAAFTDQRGGGQRDWSGSGGAAPRVGAADPCTAHRSVQAREVSECVYV